MNQSLVTKPLLFTLLSFAAANTFAGHHEGKKHQHMKHEAKVMCPNFLDSEFKVLHSDQQGNICKSFAGKPVLIVNTASHCGYTRQFKGLEQLYQKYKDEGLQVYGFASNSFNQAAKSEEEAATICYKNFGVSFNMFAMTAVKGDSANPVFKSLKTKAGEPQWNFNKYLVMPDGTVKRYGSRVEPLGSELEKDIKASIAGAS